MTQVSLHRILIAALVAALVAGAPAWTQPATRDSTEIGRFGDWRVVRKMGNYLVPATGQRGKRAICSAVFFAKRGSLEFEAKNDVAWAVYVARDGWDYVMRRGALTITSGGARIRLPAAVYGGPMISAASHELLAGTRIDMKVLRELVAKGRPISFADDRGRSLVTFPNSGRDLQDALTRAIAC